MTLLSLHHRERVARLPRPRRLALKAMVALACLLAAVTAIDFLAFVSTLESRERAGIEPADGIVALTGGADRIPDALRLLVEGRARRLLITGVNPAASAAAIAGPRHLAALGMAVGAPSSVPANPSPSLPSPSLPSPSLPSPSLPSPVPSSPSLPSSSAPSPQADLLSCCIDLDRNALNTVGNALEAARWVHARGFGSIIVVTSSYHMPRSLMELRRVLPGTRLVPYPVVPDGLRLDRWWSDPATLRVLVGEYVKYNVALVQLRLYPPTADAVQASVQTSARAPVPAPVRALAPHG